MGNKLFVMKDFKFDLQRFDSAFSGGDGSKDTPYQIASVEDLQQLSDDVNHGNDYHDKYFIVTANIDLSNIDNWQPIGDQYNSFAGVFDGGIYDSEGNLTSNHTINNLTITGNNNTQGLFGCVDGGTIKNVSLVNANISGNEDVGGIVGINSGGRIENCAVSGEISGNLYVGGIAGSNDSTIENCAVSGEISGFRYVGGIAGTTIINSTIMDSFADVKVSGSNNVGAIVGLYASGDCGGNKYCSNVDDDTDATKLYKLNLPDGVTAELISGESINVGDKTYYEEGATFKLTLNATADDWYTITGIEGAFKNFDGTFDYTIGTPLKVEGFPKIGSLAFDGIDIYTINNKADLQALADYVNAGHNCAGLNFILGANIEGVDFHIGTRGSKFAGMFEGGGYTITVAYDDGGALFNYVDGAFFRRLTVAGTINTSDKFAAGLISHSYGSTSIDNCTSSVTINSTVNGDGSHGGFVGVIEDGRFTIDDSTFNGSFIGTSTNSWGGFVGLNNAETEITGSIFNPEQISIDNTNSATFARNIHNNTTDYYTRVTDSYFATQLGTAQGEQVFTLDLPEGVNAELVNGDTVTIGDTTYYKEGATFKLTLTETSNDTFEKITGIKGLTANSDGTFTYTIGKALEFEGDAKIGSFGFDTTDNSYTISTKEQLAEFRDYVNAGNDCKGLTFKLTADLNLESIENWTPIGNNSIPFAGTFDGGIYDSEGNLTGRHTISNLTVNNPDNDYQGLFACVVGGTIKNVSLVNADISGNQFVGGIVGYSYSSTVKDSFAATKITGTNGVGAVVGYSLNGGTFSGNEYASNVGDNTGATKWLTLDLPAGVTATPSNAANKVTVDGTDYYKPDSTVKLSGVTDATIEGFHKVTGIKGLTANDDGTFDYTIGATLEFEGYQENGSLVFDGMTDTYTISNATDLQALADYVNAGNTCAGYKFILGDNIEDVVFHIGTSGSKFAGTIDGNNKTITVDYNDGGALFNYVDGATFSKLKVAGTINTSSLYTAGLISHSYGNTTIDNCTSSVTINSTVNGYGSHGGFVGVINGGKLTISNSTFDGSFIGTSTNSWGGFVGLNHSETEIKGSIFASAQIDVNTRDSATFARGSNNVTDSYLVTQLGTKQGEQVFTSLNTPEGITATYTGGDDYKLVIGGTTYYKPGATFTLTAQEGYGSKYKGYTFKAGNTVATRESDGVYNLVLGNSAKVELVGFSQIGSLGFDTTDNSYTISNETQLAEFRDYVNAGNHCQGYKFKLTNDINLAELKDGDGNQLDWTPIGNSGNHFKGTFDGGGNTINNLKITGNSNYKGLFGKNLGTVQNVSLVNAKISGNEKVGGIVGSNSGTIDNCTVSGEISGDWYVGGIAGSNDYGKIENCTVQGKISGDWFVGGIAGRNNKSMIDNCTVSGEISGDLYVGSIAGRNYDNSTIRNSFADVKVSGNEDVGAIVGYNAGTVSDNEYCSENGDNTGATRLYKLNLDGRHNHNARRAAQ